MKITQEPFDIFQQPCLRWKYPLPSWLLLLLLLVIKT